MKNTDLENVKKLQFNSRSEEEQAHDEQKILINPVIKNRFGLTEYWEACVSCLTNCGLVLRPYKIELEYYDVFGKKHEETFEGFESTVLSHEIDHLDGILHIDIAEEILQFTVEERKKWRQTHGYNIIARDGNYEGLKKKRALKKE